MGCWWLILENVGFSEHIDNGIGVGICVDNIESIPLSNIIGNKSIIWNSESFGMQTITCLHFSSPTYTVQAANVTILNSNSDLNWRFQCLRLSKYYLAAHRWSDKNRACERKRRQQRHNIPIFFPIFFFICFFRIMLLSNAMWIALSLSECHTSRIPYIMPSAFCWASHSVFLYNHDFENSISAHGNRFSLSLALSLLHQHRWLYMWTVFTTSRRFVFVIVRHHAELYIYYGTDGNAFAGTLVSYDRNVWR